MASLRDQFQKANLLSKKDAKRLAHEERVKRKEVGREGLEKQQADREAELHRQREQDRETDRKRQADLEAVRKAAEERAACLTILDNETRSVGRGPVSWHFELEDGQLPMLRMADADRHNLLGGHLCVVRQRDTDAHVYAFLATHLAKRVKRSLPDRVVWAAPGALSAAD